MRIAHISDLHIIAAPAGGLIRPDAVFRAVALMADLMACQPAIDLVVITGDNVNDGRPEEYSLLTDVLSGLTIPYVIVPGNHDTRRGFRASFPDLPYASADGLYHLWQNDDLRVFALDTLIEGETAGALDDAQLDWLEHNLAQSFAGRTLIALHHPPAPTGMGLLDRNILNGGRDRLMAVLGRCDDRVVMLCGHMHRPFTMLAANATVFAAASTAFQFALSLDDPAEPPSADEPFDYAIHIIGPAGESGHIIHRRFPGL